MGYKLGKRSLRELQGVHPRLVMCVNRAIEITPVDFSVHDGLRTAEEQAEYVASGVSHKEFSNHQRQEDGWGHAVDLVPYINRRLRWEMVPIYSIALAMREAAEAVGGITLVWGGSWTELTGSGVHPKTMSLAYIKRKMEMNQRPFVDGPHFEILVTEEIGEVE